MKLPRFSIARLMFVVLVVALDFGIIRARVGPPRLFSMPSNELLLIGALPMANVLGIGLAYLLAGRRDPGPRRPALVGFLRLGLAGWLAFVLCSILAPRGTIGAFRGGIAALGLAPALEFAWFATLVLALPQLALAGLGWWLGGLDVARRSLAVERPDGSRLLEIGGPRPARAVEGKMP